MDSMYSNSKLQIHFQKYILNISKIHIDKYNIRASPQIIAEKHFEISMSI